ncbi:MAG: hypothetical protein ACXQS2_06855 [Methermicoccaceae archaeon]
MIHATSRESCIKKIESLATLCGITNYIVIFSVQEFKKSPPTL